MIGILARCNGAKIPMARLDEPHVPSKGTKKAKIGYFPYPNWLIANLDTIIRQTKQKVLNTLPGKCFMVFRFHRN